MLFNRLYTVHFTLYIVPCTLYTVHCTLYTVHCTLYTVHCTLYTVLTLHPGLRPPLVRDVVATDDPNVAFKVLWLFVVQCLSVVEAFCCSVTICCTEAVQGAYVPQLHQ